MYVTKNGEVLSKTEMVAEIIALLNKIPGHKSAINPAILEFLESAELESILEKLRQNAGKEVESNREWLLGLAD